MPLIQMEISEGQLALVAGVSELSSAENSIFRTVRPVTWHCSETCIRHSRA